MDDTSHNNWDILFKWFGLAAVVIGGLWTYYTFRSDRQVDLEHQKQAIQRDEEARKQELNSFVFQRQTALRPLPGTIMAPTDGTYPWHEARPL
jgi:hypothetical protein